MRTPGNEENMKKDSVEENVSDHEDVNHQKNESITGFVNDLGELQKELKRKETITCILQTLESDNDNLYKIIDECIKIIYEYLNVSIIVVAEFDNSIGKTKIMGQWCDGSVNNINGIMKYMPVELSDILNEKTMLIVDRKEGEENVRQILGKYGIRSMVAVPIAVEGMPQVYAFIAETRYEMNWDTHTISYLFDISKILQSFIYKKITNKSLRKSYEALKEILNNLTSGIMVIDKQEDEDKNKRVLFCNNTLLYEMKNGRKFAFEHYLNYEKKNKKIYSAKKYYEECYDPKTERWYDIHYIDIKWVDGRIVSLCNFTDITEKKKYQQKIEFQANNDYLTGLYNRMKCEKDLKLSIDDAKTKNSSGAVLFMDLDNFKSINDGLGHQYGDKMLKMIAAKLQKIDGIENSCYRVGGDEFIIIIEPAVIDESARIIDDIRKVFASPWYLVDTSDNKYYCTMSMGIVVFPQYGDSVSELIKKSDIAMYDAKKNGKNGFCYYSDGEDENSYKKLDIEKNMRLAVEAGCNEFEVYIQPIVDTLTEQCIGGEALVRWNSSNLGFLMPGEFIPIAEHMGLIVNIGEYVLKSACLFCKKWSDRGKNLRINVNLSVIQLLANDIVEVIKTTVRDTGIEPGNLVLEVTESLAINDMTRMKRIIKDIKKLGVKIALDDFGTGYSSLNYIKSMDLDIIKVDRTFTKDIAEDEYAQAFVKLIAELSKTLEVQVCVEGVEYQEQLGKLKELNINMIQGFYYGKPMRVTEFEQRFLENTR